MFRILIIIIFVSIFSHGCDSQKTATVKGSLENVSDKTISINIGSDPRTLLKAKENAFSCEILEDGSFSFSVDFDAPIWITMISEGYQFVAYLFLMNDGENYISADCTNTSNTLKYTGANGPLNTFYREWNSYNNGVLPELKLKELSYQDWIHNLDSIESVSKKMLHDFRAKDNLTKNESLWLSSKIGYNKFSTLLSRAYRLESKPEDLDFDFFELLDLNDVKACKIDQSYNRLIHRYILHQVNLQGVYYEPADDNSQFYELMYNTALKELSGDVKDVELNILLADLLSSNQALAIDYYKRFLNDCKSQDLLEMTKHLYEEYLVAANKGFHEGVEIINTENQTPMEVLSKFENKILYLDFWASWCSPCISSIPKTMELAKHYSDKDVEVVFVGNSDQELSLESAIKKYEITGKHLILNQDESKVWKNDFDVGGIPSYVLLERNHIVVDYHAPDPGSQMIFAMIDSLLKE
jgi:thiol-disulfide isomerase/thioredoxin